MILSPPYPPARQPPSAHTSSAASAGAVLPFRHHIIPVHEFRAAIESPVSVVDRVSFAFMRREGIDSAIALDVDFRTAGFATVP